MKRCVGRNPLLPTYWQELLRAALSELKLVPTYAKSSVSATYSQSWRCSGTTGSMHPHQYLLSLGSISCFLVQGDSRGLRPHQPPIREVHCKRGAALKYVQFIFSQFLPKKEVFSSKSAGICTVQDCSTSIIYTWFPYSQRIRRSIRIPQTYPRDGTIYANETE